MGWESDQETVREPIDYTKWVWYAILIGVPVLFGLLVLASEDTHYGSRVKVKHILVAAEAGDFEARAEALEKISDLKRQLDEGANFDKIAAEFSDDYTNRDSGGMLGWVERDKMVEKFDTYLWAGRIGAVSDPVETEFGFHLILILDREISEAEQYQLDLNERLNETSQSNE